MLRKLKYVIGKVFIGVQLRKKIIVFIALLVSVSTMSMGFYMNKKFSGIIEDKSFLQISQAVRQSSNYLNEKLSFTMDQFNTLEMDNSFIKVYKNSGKANYVDDIVLLDPKFQEIRTQNSLLVDNVLFYRSDGKVFHEFTSMIDNNINFKETVWFTEAQKNPSKLLWLRKSQDSVFIGSRGTSILSMVRQVTDSMFNPYGVLLFEIKEGFLKNALNELNFGANSVALIINSEGEIISNSGKEQETQKGSTYLNNILKHKEKNGYFTLSEEGSNNLVVYDTIKVNGWRLVVIVPALSLNEDAAMVKTIVFNAVLVSIILSIIVALWMVFLITSPITKMVQLMKRAQNGDLQVRFNAKYNDEIGVLGKSFNNMLQGIQNLMDQVNEERQLKVEAELRALQAQINPHFLYNTLDSIYWTARFGDSNDAAEMAASLADLFRLSLNKGSDITTVEKEIEHVKSYLKIEKLRFGEKFDYEIKADESLLSLPMPKLILQPLVENSILHGLYEKDEKGYIHVSVYKDDVNLILAVTDNGIGMDVEELERGLFEVKVHDRKSNGYALSNVYKRIKMRYGDTGRMEFFSQPNVDTTVRVIIPL